MLKLLITITISTMISQSVQAVELSKMTYQQAQEKLSNLPSNISETLETTPRVYVFKNTEGKDSATYLGQTFRQVLTHDLKPILFSAKRASYAGKEAEAYKVLNSIYEYSASAIKTNSDMINGETEIRVKAKTAGGLGLAIAEGDYYIDIFEKGTNLKKKIAGVDNKLRKGELKGWSLMGYDGINFDANEDGKLTPDELVTGLMKVQAKNMAVAENDKELIVSTSDFGEQVTIKASITKNGWEIANLVQKIIHSAVSYSQAAGDYMSVDLFVGKGLTANNEDYYTAADGSVRSFTVLQHHWDEAYGYFGAARNYLDYTDIQLKSKISIDAFIWDDETNTHKYVEAQAGGDELASVQSEKNFGMAINAGKRDLGAKDPSQKIDLSFNTVLPFLKGRHLIQQKPEGYLEYAQAFSVVALIEWEKIFAATVVHYINDTIKDLNKYGTLDFKFENLAKHFSEMKGFSLAFQFNPNSLMTDTDFEKFHKLVGDVPVLPEDSGVDAYKVDLVKARDIISKTYGFSKVNSENW